MKDNISRLVNATEVFSRGYISIRLLWDPTTTQGTFVPMFSLLKNDNEPTAQISRGTACKTTGVLLDQFFSSKSNKRGYQVRLKS